MLSVGGMACSRSFWTMALVASAFTFACSNRSTGQGPSGGPDGGLAVTVEDGGEDGGIIPEGTDGGPRHARNNPIPAENALPGSPDWDITQNTPGQEIEGYSLRPSVRAGESVPFAVSVNPVSST